MKYDTLENRESGHVMVVEMEVDVMICIC